MAKAIKKRHITFWVVLLLALLGWWMQRQEQGPVQPLDQQAAVMDYSLSDFVITAMDEQGAPKHRLRGDSMVHYGEDDYAELVRPQLEVYGDSEGMGPMSLDAELARVYQGGDSVLLEGEVFMVRQDQASRPLMEIETRDLWFFSQREYAETAAGVTIRDARGVTTAQGMTIDMKAGTLQLLAAVRGEYVLE